MGELSGDPPPVQSDGSPSESEKDGYWPTGLELALAEVRRLSAFDGSIAVASVTSTGAWVGFPQHPPGSPARDAASLFAWCRALGAVGRRVFVFVSHSGLKQNLDGIAKFIADSGPETTCLLFADGEPPEAARTNGRPDAARRSNERSLWSEVSQLAAAVVLLPSDDAELRAAVRETDARDRAVVVLLPPRREFASAALTVGNPILPAGVADTVSNIPDAGSIRDAPAGDSRFRADAARILCEGSDMTVVTAGAGVAPALAAARRLAADGIGVALIDCRCVLPLDTRTLTAATEKTNRLLVVEDGELQGGLSAAVIDWLSASGVTTPAGFLRLRPVSGRLQDRHYSADQIARRVRRVLERSGTVGDDGRPVWFDSAGEADREAGGPWEPFALSAEQVQRDQQMIRAKRLSPQVRRWIREYKRVGHRKLYLWKWCLHGVELTTLPCVLSQWRPHVCETKLLSIILCVLFDDVADRHGSRHLLETLLQIVGSGTPGRRAPADRFQRAYAGIVRNLWRTYISRVRQCPCYDHYKDVLRYDLLQFFNTMRYAHLINRRPEMMNLVEHDVYTPHNMQMVSFSTVDLMCSPGFPEAELGALRETMWHAQAMGRIGNILSTWRREIPDRDFTGGVFARAVSQGELPVDELIALDSQRVESAIVNGGHERQFVRKWQYHRQRSHSAAKRVQSLNLEEVLDGHDRFLGMHLAAAGLI